MANPGFGGEASRQLLKPAGGGVNDSVEETG